ncbi:hypothetical protein VNI00_013359 [Paramarasmius palmivorus]|uniref:Uncharacterized protein n=1 Tax=Paramarasmius palmivorus TaxID=297713 RepID=A0AAW0C155_9AGAR
MSTRQNYQGLFRKLVIAFDVGTTYSGASYAILDPGLPPVIEGVTSFPGQLSTRGDSKIPSVIWYDQDGNVRAVGSEAADEAFLELADDEDFIKVEWFKLHLRPKHLATSHVQDNDLPPLPPSKTALDVFADFLHYLHTHSIDYIKKSRDPQFWSSIENSIDYVLTHPNGWEGPQQALMRQAAIRAGLITNADDESRLQFVTEGEASLHYCINKGIMNEPDMDRRGIIIVDAGGGTVDLSAYAKTPSGAFEEIARTQCRLQGSVYVTRRALAWLKDRLKDSKYGNNQDITHITSVFDKSTKHLFRDDTSVSYIRFGSARDKDPRVDIKGGQMKISGDVMKDFFAPSIQEIVEAIQEQQSEAHVPISSVYLVGGFAASDWLFNNLETLLERLQLKLSRPDGFVNKAVADGAVSFYLDHCVAARISRFTYGTECCTTFNPADPQHQKRANTIFLQASGGRAIPNVFDVILPKGVRIQEETEFRSSYFRQSSGKLALQKLSDDIMCYRGNADNPRWTDVEPSTELVCLKAKILIIPTELFSTLCTVEADTSKAPGFITEKYNLNQGRYYEAAYEVVLLFGMTELKAQICWKENGEEKRGPATIVYDQINELR